MKKAIFITILLSLLVIIGCDGDDIVEYDDELFVYLHDDTVTVYYNEPYEIEYDVFVTTDQTVKFFVNGIENGNDTLGTIDTANVYLNEGNSVTIDEVWIKAVSQVDTTKSDSTQVIIRDRNFVYVDILGNDATGKGTFANPYRTITAGLASAIQGQAVKVAEGTYSDGETFPLVPRFEVDVQGTFGISDTTIIQPPSESAAFRFEFERSSIKDLIIRGANKQGIGVQYTGESGIDTLSVTNILIDNVHTAAKKTGQASNIVFTNNTVTNCVYGLVIDEPGEKVILTGTDFASIDSVAVKLIDPITSQVDFNTVTIDGAWIGFVISEGSFSVMLNSAFANIDSAAVLIETGATGAQISGPLGQNNDFSAMDTWCVFNLSAATIDATNNDWPSSDSTTIDTQYIYDDDETGGASGAVLF